MNWKELKETIGFKMFKNDYIRIFETHHPQQLKKIEGYKQSRIFKTNKCEDESILNYINTNVLAYSILVNETLTKVNFNPSTKEGYETMMEYVITNKWYWLGILPKINDKISYTSPKGGKKEDLVKTKLIEYFNKTKGGYEVISIGKLGNLNDMIGGYDIVIRNNKDGKEFKAQIKTCSSIILNENNSYEIKYNGINKLYNGIDYMICVVGNDVHIFDNKMILNNKDGYTCEKDGLKQII
jgi:hypothetical protein